ncbi:MAG: iron-containing alcohol dehydrogenase [Oligoflexus sp.]
MSIRSFRFPTDIRFGQGSIQLLPELLKQGGKNKPLLVTDKGLAQLPVCRDVIALLETAGLSPVLYADAEGNPVETHVSSGVKLYQQQQADSIIMLGGGCAIDVGKAIALMVHHSGQLFDYEDDKPGARPIDQDIPLTIAIPTTAGTGSEVGGSSVISDDKTHEKVIVWSPRLIPKHVIADPVLTIGLPAFMTAATGIDALTHNIEAFLAKNYHPICDGIALEGIRLVAENLEKAVKVPGDLEARSGMLLASMMGAIAFQKGLGVTHSCAHALSTCYDLHHGLANALMIEPCMAFNAEVVPERIVRMAKTIGLEGSNQELIGKFNAWLKKLKQAIQIPASLAEYKVEVSDRLLEVAIKDACHANNPRPCSKDDFARIFQQALAGG